MLDDSWVVEFGCSRVEKLWKNSLQRSGSGHPAPPPISLSFWKQPAMGLLALTRCYNSYFRWQRSRRVRKGRKKKRKENDAYSYSSHCVASIMTFCYRHVSLPAAFHRTSDTCCLFLTNCSCTQIKHVAVACVRIRQIIQVLHTMLFVWSKKSEWQED